MTIGLAAAIALAASAGASGQSGAPAIARLIRGHVGQR
jgi:hypothetical protein